MSGRVSAAAGRGGRRAASGVAVLRPSLCRRPTAAGQRTSGRTTVAVNVKPPPELRTSGRRRGGDPPAAPMERRASCRRSRSSGRPVGITRAGDVRPPEGRWTSGPPAAADVRPHSRGGERQAAAAPRGGGERPTAPPGSSNRRGGRRRDASGAAILRPPLGGRPTAAGQRTSGAAGAEDVRPHHRSGGRQASAGAADVRCGDPPTAPMERRASGRRSRSSGRPAGYTTVVDVRPPKGQWTSGPLRR